MNVILFPLKIFTVPAKFVLGIVGVLIAATIISAVFAFVLGQFYYTAPGIYEVINRKAFANVTYIHIMHCVLFVTSVLSPYVDD